MIYYIKEKLLQRKCQNWELSPTEWQWLVWSVRKEVCICIDILAFHLKYPIEVPKTKERLQIALFLRKFLFWFQYWHLLSFCRAVTEISSCRVNTTSRRGIKQLGISFGHIFLLFSMKVAGGNPWPPDLNDRPDFVTTCWKMLEVKKKTQSGVTYCTSLKLAWLHSCKRFLWFINSFINAF